MIRVNDFVIDVSEYQNACNTFMMHAQRSEMSENEKNAIVQQLIGAKLLLEESKKAGVEVTEGEVEELVAQVKSQFPDGDAAFESAIASIGDTLDSFKAKLKDDVGMQKFLDQEFYSKIDISAEDAKDFYSKNPQMFESSAKVQASHILVKEEAEAVDLQKQLAAGADFAKLAEEKSLCPSGKSSGGDLGLFQKGQMVPEFDEAVFSMAVGEVSEPVKTQFGYHLISLTDKQESSNYSFDEVQNDLVKYLNQQEAEKRIATFVQGLMDQAKIVVDESLM
ncbi:MAG: peptidylprolyl isomerase [Spirochaetales bacterium]|nr:peptidylprolyl isomerase [Spirochaetales bacterium]